MLKQLSIAIACITALAISSANGQYYYSLNRQIALEVDYSRVRIRFDQELDSESRQLLLSQIPQVTSELSDDLNYDRFFTYHVTVDVAGYA